MKTPAHELLLCLLTLLTTLTARAQTGMFRSLLHPDLKIVAEAETEKYAWFGTEKGLYMVKKKNKKVYRLTASTSELPDDRITSIAALPNGEVYVGTTKGILRYDNYAFLRVDTENSGLPSNDISDLYTDSLGRITAVTRNHGVHIFPDRSSGNFCCRTASKNTGGRIGRLKGRESKY